MEESNMVEEWRRNSVPETGTKDDGTPINLIRYPDSFVPMVPSGAHFSRNSKYLCGAAAIDGVCLCSAHDRPRAFGATCFRLEDDDQDYWLCPNDMNRLCGTPQELQPFTPISRSHDDPFYLNIDEEGRLTMPLVGGCVEEAMRLGRGHVMVTNRDPPPDDEVDAQGPNIWYTLHPGDSRGSKFIGAMDSRKVSNALRSMEKSRDVLEFYEKRDGGKIFFIVPAMYLESKLFDCQISFRSHCDRKYKWKPPFRSNWTWCGKEGKKVMRFQNRRTGRFIDIACFHGTIVEQDWYASGCQGPNECEAPHEPHEMEHAVFNASGTATITFDHGNHQLSEDDFAAAFAEYEKEILADEAEGGDEDEEEEVKKPAAKRTREKEEEDEAEGGDEDEEDEVKKPAAKRTRDEDEEEEAKKPAAKRTREKEEDEEEGDPTDPTPIFAQYGFLPTGCNTIFCKAIHLEPQIKELGYEFNELLIQTDTGEVYPAVWDVFLLKILQDYDIDQASQFTMACQNGDEATKETFHNNYFAYTLEALREHVYSIMNDVDNMTMTANSYDLDTHPRVPVIVAHNNLVRDTFSMTAYLLDSMG